MIYKYQPDAYTHRDRASFCNMTGFPWFVPLCKEDIPTLPQWPQRGGLYYTEDFIIFYLVVQNTCMPYTQE